MAILITLFSYLCTLVLFSPATATGLINAFLVFLCGCIWYLLNKPLGIKWSVSRFSLCASVFPMAFYGPVFYRHWIPSSSIHAIASLLHIPGSLFIGMGAALLCLGATVFAAGVLLNVAPLLKIPASVKEQTKRFYCIFLSAVVTIILAQIMAELNLFSLTNSTVLRGALIVATVSLALYCVFGKIPLSISLGTGLFMILSTVNAYVFEFRGRLLDPVDIHSFGAAMNVAGNYHFFPIPTPILMGWLIWIFMIVCVHCICGKDSLGKITHKSRIALILCTIACGLYVNAYTANPPQVLWDRGGAASIGYILNFANKLQDSGIDQPESYSAERIQRLSQEYSPADSGSEEKPSLPHIIVIMDEAFSDLSVLGALNTDKEVTPYFSSIARNTVSGYALSSVYGGNTANSEFEMLTGHSMAWMPANSVPYQQYLTPPTYSIVSYLKNMFDYRCIAMHPFNRTGWNRVEAYSNIGFDEQYFLEDFPQEQLIRDYVSDQEMFEMIVDTSERYADSPMFLFGITMQNHGDYIYSGDNFVPSVSLVGYEEEYPRIEQYLSLIHETDNALPYLISHFEKAERDVVILFFGDHQPTVRENIFGTAENLSLEESQKQYLVPFFVWTNFDMEPKNIPCTSLNYLSNYVLQAAGLPLPPYNQFLSQMEQIIPAINANGYYSAASGEHLPLSQASGEEQQWLQSYQNLQYNGLFDAPQRNEVFFPKLK